MFRLLPCVMPDLIRNRVLVLEFVKPISPVRPGQPIVLQQVAQFSMEEASGKTATRLIEEAYKRFKPCPNDVFEVLISDDLEFKEQPL